jgi:hypothetical protein
MPDTEKFEKVHCPKCRARLADVSAVGFVSFKCYRCKEGVVLRFPLVTFDDDRFELLVIQIRELILKGVSA